MFKNELLNSDLCRVLSQLGHTDQITIGDAGLPIPNSAERIDLAIIKGLPSFIDVLQAVLKSMQVEKVVLAEEIKKANSKVHMDILQLLENYGSTVEVVYLSHHEFKQATGNGACKAVVRTGECTPYANIILESGVVF